MTQTKDIFPQAFLDAYEKLVLDYNRQLSAAAAKETNFCQPGCSSCCNQVFFESTAHVELIARRLEHSPELLEKFQAQLRERKRLLAANEEKVREISALKDNGEFSAQWLALKIPCALLSEQLCLVYEIRPTQCAAYITLSPPRVCAIDPKGYHPPVLVRLRRAFAEETLRLCRRFKVKPELIYDLSWYLDARLNPADVQPPAE